MQLYLVRHAWAGEHGDAGPNDDERPLTAKGIKRFRVLMELLAQRGVNPGRIATSPLVRCRQTAELIAEAVENHPPIDVLEALSPGARLEDVLQWNSGQADGQSAWVGHAPDVGRLAAELIGGRAAQIHLPKGAVASIEFDAAAAAGRGVLTWLVTANMLGC